MEIECCWNFDRKYGLDDNTIDFIGHALALHRDDRYLNEPALDTVKRMKVKTAFDFFLIIIIVNCKFLLYHGRPEVLSLLVFVCGSYTQSLLHDFKEDHHTFTLCMGLESCLRSTSLAHI